MEERFINGHHNIAISLSDGVFSCAVVEADYHDWDEAFWVARCYVRPEHRMHGLGTRVMTRLCAELDDRGARAYLLPNPYDDTISLRRLIAFYGRFGFKRGRVGDTPCWVRESAASSVERKRAAAATDAR